MIQTLHTLDSRISAAMCRMQLTAKMQFVSQPRAHFEMLTFDFVKRLFQEIVATSARIGAGGYKCECTESMASLVYNIGANRETTTVKVSDKLDINWFRDGKSLESIQDEQSRTVYSLVTAIRSYTGHRVIHALDDWIKTNIGDDLVCYDSYPPLTEDDRRILVDPTADFTVFLNIANRSGDGSLRYLVIMEDAIRAAVYGPILYTVIDKEKQYPLERIELTVYVEADKWKISLGGAQYIANTSNVRGKLTQHWKYSFCSREISTTGQKMPEYIYFYIHMSSPEVCFARQDEP
jgi:hypothetical protein